MYARALYPTSTSASRLSDIMPKKIPEFQFSEEQSEILHSHVLDFREGSKAQRKALVKQLVGELCPAGASDAIRSLYTNVSVSHMSASHISHSFLSHRKSGLGSSCGAKNRSQLKPSGPGSGLVKRFTPRSMRKRSRMPQKLRRPRQSLTPNNRTLCPNTLPRMMTQLLPRPPANLSRVS